MRRSPTRPRTPRRPARPTRDRKVTITVAKGLCAPARDQITGLLAPYGVVIHGLEDYVIDAHGRRLTGLSLFDVGPKSGAAALACAVTVNAQAAAWVEYLLLRSQRYKLISRPIDPNNRRWAMAHGGRMPQAWVDPGCTEAAEPASVLRLSRWKFWR